VLDTVISASDANEKIVEAMDDIQDCVQDLQAAFEAKID
jgi:hypothetical protein